MDAAFEADTASIISRPCIPAAVQDIQRSKEKQLAMHLILASILFETAAFFLFELNLISSLQFNERLHWESSHSSTASDIFEGINLISMVIFAVISDAKLNRARTIVIGFSLYLIGFTLMTLIENGTTPICKGNEINNGTAISTDDKQCFYQILSTIIVTAIGAGAVRSNMVAFGADQIQESIVASRYIDKFVVAIHIGSIIMSLTGIIIPDDHDQFFRLYAVGTSMLFVSALLFIIGWRYYIHVNPYDSVVTNCIPVFINAFQTWRQCKKNKRSTEQRNLNVSTSNFADDSDGCAREQVEESIKVDESRSTFLDFAKVVNNGKFHDRIVNDVKLFRNAIIVFILLLPYKLVIYQLYTTFESQASYMAHEGDIKTVEKVLLSESVAVIIGVFILNMFVYKYLHARNRTLTIATKFIVSMCLAVITMCIAGVLEILRQHCCSGNQANSNLSIYAQLVQDIGVGFAQLFALLGTFEFAYFFAPRSAQSLFMSLHYISRGIASYIIDAYTRMLKNKSFDLSDFSCPTVKNHEWQYFTYFFILAGVLFAFIIIFIVCQKIFRMTKRN